MLKRAATFIIVIIAMLSNYSFCATRGEWGISANNMFGNSVNEIFNIGTSTQAPVPSLFYQFTDDLSIDFGASAWEYRSNSDVETNINATYLKVLYNLGRGVIIPHVGLEYVIINTRTADDATFASDFACLFGAEVSLMQGLSLLADIKLINNASVLYSNDSFGRYSAVTLYPFLSVRWYI